MKLVLNFSIFLLAFFSFSNESFSLTDFQIKKFCKKEKKVSLCSSTNFEAKEINEISEKSRKEFKNKTSKEILELLIEKSNSKLYPSRILNLAIYTLISSDQDLKDKDESGTNKMISDIFEKLNLSANKAEKDIGIYKSSISKLEQAKELIEELRIKDKKKDQK